MIRRPVGYCPYEDPWGRMYCILETAQEHEDERPIARCREEETAKELCDLINGNVVTQKEQEYRDFVMLLQRQRAEAGVDTKDMLSSQLTFLLGHAAMGMVTESAEIMDTIKKHLVYRQPLNFLKIKDELGDLLFYMTMAIIECKSNFNEIIDLNVAKLKVRYKTGYSHEQANNRNTEAEQVAQQKLEGLKNADKA